MRFVPRSLDFVPRLGEGWVKSKRVLLFEFENYGDKVALKLMVGPGDQQLRERIRAAVREHPRVFNKARQTFYPKFWCCHKESWLSQKQYQELTVPELADELEKRFERFLHDRLPQMESALAPLREEFQSQRPD